MMDAHARALKQSGPLRIHEGNAQLTPLPKDREETVSEQPNPALNTDDPAFGGSGCCSGAQPMEAEPCGEHGKPWSVRLNLPPLGALFLKWKR